ncbi:MAG TPA: hypothetical protein VGI76_01145 [Solirubrobacteraceae bacterium]
MPLPDSEPDPCGGPDPGREPICGHGWPDDFDCGVFDCGVGVDFDGEDGVVCVVVEPWVLDPELGAAAAPASPAAAPPAARALTTTAAFSMLFNRI